MEFVPIRSFDNYIEANIVMSMLQDHNINCHLKDENIITLDPLLSPALGGMKLMVHYAHIDRAWDLIEQAQKRYLESIACPICKKHALKAISVHKQYRCKLSALASMLLKGQPVSVTKMYQCGECGYDFKELPEPKNVI